MDWLTLIIIIVAVIILTIIIVNYSRRDAVSVDVLYADALNSILKGDNATAVKLLKQVVNRDSDNIGAYLQLGNLVRSYNPMQSAKIHQSLTVRPKLDKHISKEIHQALALDYQEIENYNRAKIEAEMVLKYDKNDLWAHQFLLRIAENNHNWDEARQLADKIQKISGKKDARLSSKIQLQAGKGYAKDGDTKKAFQHLHKAVKLDPDFSEPYLELGNLYKRDNNVKKAIINWENYLIYSENSDSDVYKKIETALFESNRFSEAEHLYKRILNKKPDDIYSVVKLTKLLVDRGDGDQASKIIEDCIKNKEDFLVAKLLKIKLSIDTKKPVDIKNQIDDLIDTQ
jgi:lipopolysaccharide biosynthesis regulator YciM